MAMGRRSLRLRAIAVAVLAFALVAEPDPLAWITGNGFVGQAEARVGRPVTPVSAAGVARRTTRRVIRRTSAYVSTLPAGCVTVSMNGGSYYRCGATYYQPYGNQYVVVIVD